MTAYVQRPDLIARLRGERIALIEGPGGYGKSVLAGELREELGLTSVSIELDRRRRGSADLVGELSRGLRRAKLANLAPVTTLVRDHDDALDDLIEALGARTDPLLFSVDDAQALEDDGRRLLMRLAAELPRPHRLLVVKRGFGDLCRYLRPEKPVACIAAADLQLSEEEMRMVFEAHDARLAAHDLSAVVAATAGWPAAVARLAQLGGAQLHEHSRHDVVAKLLREQLADLPADAQRAVPQLAHLPWLTRELADAVTELPDLLDQLARAGIPMLEDEGLRIVFPAPVREHLASLATIKMTAARVAANEYVSLGATDAAVGVLLAAGKSRDAAKLLADLPPFRVENLGYVELKTTADLLAPEAVRAFPRVLLHVARRAELALDFRTRTRALRRLEKIAEEKSDKQLLHEVWAERARDLARDGSTQEAEALATQTLREAGADDELRARARSLETIGHVRAAEMWDSASLKAAEAKFMEADVLARWATETTWAAQALHGLAWDVHFVRGEIEPMVARLTEALTLLQAPNRFRAVVLTARARGFIYVGRYADAERDLDEAEGVGNLLRDALALAEVALERARITSQAYDPAQTVAHITEAERHLNAANGHANRAAFLADAAVLLDRIGETKSAEEFLSRAHGELEADDDAVLLAGGLLLARSGDPADAEDRFEAIEAGLLFPPRERWRVQLFRAFAAERRGDPAAAQLAVAAFDAADSLGLPLLPLVQEHALAERLVAAAAGAGSRAAAALPVENLPLTVYVLGRFAVVRGGLEVPLPPGRPEKVVKYLAARGGRAHVEEAVEALWPNVAPASGRKRLRNVLSRLREACSELVVRKGEMLSIDERVEVDAYLFERDARRALGENGSNGGSSTDAVATARAAVARYAGELLPDDLYEPWAAQPRERLRLRCLSLLDLLAAASRANNNSHEELVALERAMEVDPDDAGRYFAAAESLRAQGKRLAAYSMLLRANSALKAAGLDAPRAFHELAQELRNDVAGKGNDPVVSR